MQRGRVGMSMRHPIPIICNVTTLLYGLYIFPEEKLDPVDQLFLVLGQFCAF